MRWPIALHVTGLILLCVGLCMVFSPGLRLVLR
jgi:hypothetical protein